MHLDFGHSKLKAVLKHLNKNKIYLRLISQKRPSLQYKFNFSKTANVGLTSDRVNEQVSSHKATAIKRLEKKNRLNPLAKCQRN